MSLTEGIRHFLILSFSFVLIVLVFKEQDSSQAPDKCTYGETKSSFQ